MDTSNVTKVGYFKVLIGKHQEGLRIYNEGEVVESVKDLEAFAPEKFKRVDPPPQEG